ncbi:MAG: sigma 54-interacting transcriptional regulator [Rhodospirillaceae bacterium]|nr:sigma 54-interacting transcriptional regulator [Rhodospirillaceae bacterium]
MRDVFVKKLEEMNKELDDVLETSHDGFVVADHEGKFIRVNRSYESITGIPREEILGKTADYIVQSGLISDSATSHVLKTGRPYTFTQTFPGGRHSVVTGSPLFDEQGQIYRVVTNVRDMGEIAQLKAELIKSQEQLNHYSRIVETLTEEQMVREKLVFRSRVMGEVRNNALKFAKVDAPLLITGESGCGKEVVANLVYRNSPRKGLPFLTINCGAIPENLLESELFGYEGGAFTGARKGGQAGLLEIANGGTVMLDEIGELPLALQVKLLRFVQQKEFFRVGGKKLITVDVRLIAATNRNLQQMVDQKIFRSDLFYRLNVLNIHIPPLRERREDIIPLANYMLDKYNKKYGVSRRLTSDLYRAFTKYSWMGNVREFENLIERLVVICDREEITSADVPDDMRGTLLEELTPSLSMEKSYREAREDFEREFLQKAIEKYKSTRQTARIIGLDHSTIVKKAAKYGIGLLPRWQ